jgi:acrylyl-CoA reductase (NADPH)
VRALVYSAPEDALRVREIAAPAGDDVIIDVAFSALNYKDWLVAQPQSRARRVETLVLGVEASGTVAASADPRFPVGTTVAAFGGPIGVAGDGGLATQLGAPAAYVTAVPGPLDARAAATLGLAGYTAMASALAIEGHGCPPGAGPVLVTGATGGVGSLAVAVLAQRGHHVVASSGSPAHTAWLTRLGARDVIGRDEVTDRPDRTLGTERWAGAIDCVGGATLPAILRSLRYGAAVAASGLVAGAELTTTVYPFITRAVSLIGIDAVEAPTAERDLVWAELARLRDVDGLVETEVGLNEVPDALARLGRGATRGRVLVDPAR